ncbi:hypothetical protein [Agromyces sp. LHK192]|uniref:hypothetical protein n=1 Tax=Agromyces sp. LHK192 TaxID=2498704 RepID=UPI000FDB7147|nr:hypothetical protein [Agromyces sp. LHK192]
MSWWQEYQGFVIVGALFALVGVLAAVRIRMRAWTGDVAKASAEGRTWQDNPDPAVTKALASLATVVHVPLEVGAAADLLADAKLPRFWRHDDPREWNLPASAIDPTPITVARLEPAPDGSTVRLVRAQEFASVPHEADWRKLRRALAKAAEARGITVAERLGPQLVRTPTTDVSNLSPGEAARTPHVWLAPAPAPPGAG